MRRLRAHGPMAEKVFENYLVVSQNKGPQHRPQYTIVLVMWTSKKGTPNFGKPPFNHGCRVGKSEVWRFQEGSFGSPKRP